MERLAAFCDRESCLRALRRNVCYKIRTGRKSVVERARYNAGDWLILSFGRQMMNGESVAYLDEGGDGCRGGFGRVAYVRQSVLLSAGESAIDHALEHRDQGIFGHGMLDVDETLFPALRHEKTCGGIAGGTLHQRISQPDE